MAPSEYLYQLIGHMFGSESQTWLDTPNPDPPFNGAPPAQLVDRRASRADVLGYLEGLSSTAAVKRAQALQNNTQVGE